MRIMVLAHNLRAAGGLSVGLNIVAALGTVAQQHEFCFVVPAEVGYENVAFPAQSQIYFYQRSGGLIGQRWFEFRKLPRLVSEFKPEIVWGLGNFGLRKPPCPQAFLLQESHFFYSPRHMPHLTLSERLQIAFARKRMIDCLPTTQLIFCQTRTAIKRFREWFRYSGELAVLPNAVSKFANTPSDTAPPIFKELRGKTVLLCVSKYYPHKNLESLVELYRRYSEQLDGVVILLTIAANQGARAPALLRDLESPLLKGRMINVGPLRQDELAGYYRHSNALILPTLLESFTATYLEAMQFDCPVLTSDLDFARELCGDAAIYFDPWDVDDICKSVLRLRDEPNLQSTLRMRGHERIEHCFRNWNEIVSEAIQRLEMLSESTKLPTSAVEHA